MKLVLTGPVQVGALVRWLEVDQLPPLGGGGGRPVALLAGGLLERGHDVTVVTVDEAVEREVVLSGPRLTVRVGHRRPRHRAREAFRAERAYLVAALRSERADLVHAHWTYEYALAALASGAPTLVTVHDWAPTVLAMFRDPYRAVRLLMAVRVFQRGRHFTAPSPYLAAKVRRLRPVQVVPNALPDEAFRPPSAGTAGPPLLLAVNDGFSRLKNVSTLLRAFALLRRRMPDCRLVLVGEGYAPGGVAQEGVELLGPLPHERVRELMGAATVFVHPSLEESFGLVLAEAMAQGVPVVAGADSGAVGWVVGGGGLLTDVRSPERLAAAIGRLLDDPAEAARLGRAGYERAWANFRLTDVADRYLDVYAEVARTTRGRTGGGLASR